MTDQQPTFVRRQRPLLGTFVEIGARDSNQMQAHHKAAIQAVISSAFDVITQVHEGLSFQDPKSTLSKLNATPGEWVTIDPLSHKVLRLAKAVTRASGGLFNCTVGGALVAKGILPDHGGPAALEAGTADDIEISRDAARLKRPVRVTLDGIAKGYAVDLAVETLTGLGTAAGWVNAGGDMRAFGGASPLVHRQEADGTRTPLGRLGDGAIASSARRAAPDARHPGWIVGGERPAEDTVWTVIANTAWRADALTKVAALAPPEDRASLISRLGGHLVTPALENAA